MTGALRQIWEFRFSGRIQEVREAISSFSPVHDSDRAQIAMLLASILRYEGKLDESDDAFAEIEQNFGGSVGAEVRFVLAMQKGLNLFVRARYAEALQFFLTARIGSIDSTFDYLVKCNVLWCLEYLGLPTEAIASEVKELERGEDAEHFSQYREQTDAFRVRCFFRSRDLDALRALDPLKLHGQARLTWQWSVECLILQGAIPIHEAELSNLRAQSLSSLEKDGYQRSYIFGTFLGGCRSTAGVRLKDACDRIYLWTWRWLIHPNSVALASLRRLRQEILRRGETESLGSDDFQQWRNAVLWIGFFEGKSWQSLRNTISLVQPFHYRSDPHYEFEFKLLERLFAEQRMNDAGWRSLPKALKERIRTRSVRRFPVGAKLIVDREIGQIWNIDQGRKTSSERLVRLVLALHERPRIRSEDAIRHALGIRRIDPIHHYPIWNELVARARRYLPKSLDLKMMGGYLVCEGNWREVAILGANAEESMAVVRNRSVGKREGRLLSSEAKVIGLFVKNSEVDRESISDQLNISRASANRLINRMLVRGVLEKIGKTKGSRYRLNAKYVTSPISHRS